MLQKKYNIYLLINAHTINFIPKLYFGKSFGFSAIEIYLIDGFSAFVLLDWELLPVPPVPLDFALDVDVILFDMIYLFLFITYCKLIFNSFLYYFIYYSL